MSLPTLQQTVAGLRRLAIFATAALAGSLASASLGWWLTSAAAETALPERGTERGEDGGMAQAKAGDASPPEAGRSSNDPSSSASVPSAKALARARAEAKSEVFEAVNERNLFCPECDLAREALEVQEAAEAMAAGIDSEVLPATELPLRLVATMQGPAGEEAFATIEHTESRRLGVYARDERVLPDTVLARIGRGRVVLTRLDPRGTVTNIEQLRFQPKAPPPKKKPKKKKSKKKKKKSKYELPGARDAISCKDGNCVVDRKFVQGLLANPAKLNRQAKFKTYRKGGTKGFRMYRIRKGTIGQLMGMKNGDILTAVNGQALDSVDQVMAMYTKLRRANHLTLAYERKGKTHELNIDIR